jgi:hypothetical protein
MSLRDPRRASPATTRSRDCPGRPRGRRRRVQGLSAGTRSRRRSWRIARPPANLSMSAGRGRSLGLGRARSAGTPVGPLPIVAPGQLAKLWALRDGASALLAPVLRPPAGNGDVAACPKAVLAPVRAPRAANGGVAACPKVWVGAQSGLGRHPRNLRTDPGRADRVRLCREDEDCGGERQRGEGGGQPGTSAGTGLLSRHDHSSFRGGSFARSGRRVLRACCGSPAIRLRNGCGRKVGQEPQVAW